MSVPETRVHSLVLALTLGGRQETKKTGGDTMAEANQSFDARRMAREQESRMAATASMGLNVAQPFVQFQTSMLRVFAENIEQAARNYEKSFEAVSNIIAQQSQARQ
jgi:hypothetical protein